MTFDEVMAALNAGPCCGDELLAGVRAILAADDLSAGERGAFATGFLAGAGYTLAMSNEGRTRQSAQTLLQLCSEWQAHGII